MKAFILGGIVAAALMSAGCEVETRPATVGVGVAYAEPDTYYLGGAYVDGVWVWHDRDGHVHREERAIHERRAREFQEHHGEARVAGHHEERHEEHR
jgi:hypothetical protein